jgi:hypothetical protein
MARIGDTIEFTSWGAPIRGTVTMIGHYTGKPSQIRRHDTGQLRAIMPQTEFTVIGEARP